MRIWLNLKGLGEFHGGLVTAVVVGLIPDLELPHAVGAESRGGGGRQVRQVRKTTKTAGPKGYACMEAVCMVFTT